jgi:hypothetical protein
MGRQDRMTFRSSFRVILRWSSMFCGLLGAFVYGTSWALGHPTEPLPTLGLTVFLGLYFAVAILLFPVYVLYEGIRCYDFSGAYHTIRWHKVGGIQRRNFLGLRYLLVKSTEGGAIWLPMWLSDMESFTVAVGELAGPDHPLYLAIQEYRVTR